MKSSNLSLLLFILLLTACGKTAPVTVASPIATEVEQAPAATTQPTAIATEQPIATAEPSPMPDVFRLDTVVTDPDVLKELRSQGVEPSIIKEANGTYTTRAISWSSDLEQHTDTTEINITTLTAETGSINMYGNTPTVETADGSLLFWSREHKGWFAASSSPGIHNPTVLPREYADVAVRVLIHENPAPFSQSALERWTENQGQNSSIQAEYRLINARTLESKKWAYLGSYSYFIPGLTLDNTLVQVLPGYFATPLPDGTMFTFFGTKWLHSPNPRDPQGGDGKVLLCAPGTEITDNEHDRISFGRELHAAKNNAPVRVIIPIIKADPEFFDDPNLSTILPIPQPSLAKLLELLPVFSCTPSLIRAA